VQTTPTQPLSKQPKQVAQRRTVGTMATVSSDRKLVFDRRNEFKTVLAIDGGGLRGLIPAAMLEGVEQAIKEVAVELKLTDKTADDFDVDLADYFDVAAGSSTGAIVAAYVASRGAQATKLPLDKGLKEAAQIKKAIDPSYQTSTSMRPGSPVAAQALFLTQADTIFPTSDGNWFQKGLDLWQQIVHGGKYPASGVESVFRQAFSDKNMTEVLSDTSLVLTSYNVDYSRPMIFYYNAPTSSEGDVAESGYAALRRTLSAEEDASFVAGPRNEAQAAAGGDGPGLSDIVRVRNVPFKLWQVVRASTAEPTFFPAASVDNPAYKGGNGTANIKSFLCAGAGVIVNNPAAVALTFASSKFKSSLVPRDGQPAIAILSLGCGTSTALATVDKDAGAVGWGLGPIIGILLSGGGELNAAIDQQLARDWGAGPFQWLRLQISANYTAGKKRSTLAFMGGVVVEDESDERWAPFERALKGSSIHDVLTKIDDTTMVDQLLGVGFAVVRDKLVLERLKQWVRLYVLPEKK
jgi:hypothetical protein